MTAPGLVRVDTHKLVFVLYGLCQCRREDLVFEPHPDVEGVVVLGFEGRRGGTGKVAIADDAGLRATLVWLARHRDGEPYLRAVWAALRSCERSGLPWAHERAVELLWGVRDQRESRARQVPRVRDLVKLLCQATWSLDASVAPQTNKAKGGGDRDRQQQRAAYGGAFAGTLVSIDTDRVVAFDAELRRQLDGGPYDPRPAAVFRLRIPGHRNPRGHRPSRAARSAARHAVGDYARMRQQAALNRGGAVQAICVEDLLDQWTSVDVAAIRSGGRMGAFVDVLEEDLAAGVLGDVILPAPIHRVRRPGRCELRLCISMNRRPQAAKQPGAADSRRRRGDRRPGAPASASGKASTTGPPRR